MAPSHPRSIGQRGGGDALGSSLTAALLSSSARQTTGSLDHSDIAACDAMASSSNERDSFMGASSFIVGSPWGGPRSGASLFLRPAWGAGSNRQRASLEGELRNMSRTYSVAESPGSADLEELRSCSRELTSQSLGMSPPGMPFQRFHTAADNDFGNRIASSKHDVDNQDVEAQDMPHKATSAAAAAYTSTVYGLINGIVGLPTMISFVAIIYKDPVYKPWLGQLAKLGFFASGVHQAVFAIMSTLPYAVGQVQDVGLIFLSAMATSIASLCTGSARMALGTALTWLAFSTFVVGLAIVGVGKRKLATLVQYMPIQTVGAYLGYVGYFCIAAGIGLGVSEDIGSIPSWRLLFGRLQLIKLVPTLASTAALLLTLKLSRNPLALPAVLVAVPVAFHIVRVALGYTMADAINHGWLIGPSEGDRAPFWTIYELFNWQFQQSFPFIEGIAWSSMLRQIPSLVALFLVVTFGSALDVAAIQSDTPYPLDFNAEMITVGTANVIAGAVGAGMTGSYIFSQTIFSMRAGVTNRFHGAIVAVMELALFFLPVSVISYMPTLFYGSLLVMFGVDISNDWLVQSYTKVTRGEYTLLILTFFAILQFGLELGILIGLVLSLFSFAFSYARAHVASFTLIPSRSGVMRPYDHSICLDVLSTNMVSLSVSGYLFFGSSLAISDRVLNVVTEMLQRDNQSARVMDLATRANNSLISSSSSSGNGSLEERARKLLQQCPHFVVLDLKRLHGLDATAARTLGTLWATLKGRGVQLLFTCLRSTETVRLLRAHGVPLGEVVGEGAEDVSDEALHFNDLEIALRYCEQSLLKVAAREGLCQLGQRSMTLSSIVKMHMQNPQPLYSEPVDADRAARDLQRVMRRQTLLPGEVLFTAGDPSDEVYFIVQGSLKLLLSFQVEDRMRTSFPGSSQASPSVQRLFEYFPGAILGQKDFLLGTPRTATATCGMLACTLHVVPRNSFDTLRQRSPEALIVLMSVMLRSGAMTESHAVETLGAAQI